LSAAERPLLICGTRSFAEEVADVVSDTPGFTVAGFVENLDRGRCAEPLLGLPVHWIDDIAELAPTHSAVCALATTKRRAFTQQVEERGVGFATIVHPTARVSRLAELGAGTIASVGVIVAAHTRVGRHVVLNRAALVGHHTTVGDHVSLMPGSNVAGNCQVGDGVFVGMGAIVLDNLNVGSDAVVAAGAVVTRDVPAGAQVMGVPARVVPGVHGPR
jgi:sugar O-acyltransferase (sialic acid O-acetyltransferase NeuD family)